MILLNERRPPHVLVGLDIARIRILHLRVCIQIEEQSIREAREEFGRHPLLVDEPEMDPSVESREVRQFKD